MSYETYRRGLRFLEGPDPLQQPTTREGYELAARTLESLRSAVIGAGSNTWRQAKDRYRLARVRFESFDVPCEVVLYNVSERCPRLGPKGYCEKCSLTVKRVMQATCSRYGIVLDCTEEI